MDFKDSIFQNTDTRTTSVPDLSSSPHSFSVELEIKFQIISTPKEKYKNEVFHMVLRLSL